MGRRKWARLRVPDHVSSPHATPSGAQRGAGNTSWSSDSSGEGTGGGGAADEELATAAVLLLAPVSGGWEGPAVDKEEGALWEDDEGPA